MPLALLLVTLLGVAACATGRHIERVPLDVRLEGLYGHRLDVARPPESPRNPEWENARLNSAVRVGRYLEEHPALPEHLAAALSRQELIPGLTMEHVRLLWGPPDRVRQMQRHHDAPSAEAVWHYRWPHHTRLGVGSCQLSFHDGVLERIAFSMLGVTKPIGRDSSGSRAQD